MSTSMSNAPVDEPVRAALDELALKETFGTFASGLTIVTGMDDDGPVGFTCQAFHSVSLEPPIISLGIMRTSTSFPRLRTRGIFTVNLLSAEQEGLARQFASRGTDKWAGVDWRAAALGAPVLEGCLAAFECELWAEYEVGDHIMAMGLVRELHRDLGGGTEPLVYYRSRFRGLAAV